MKSTAPGVRGPRPGSRPFHSFPDFAARRETFVVCVQLDFSSCGFRRCMQAWLTTSVLQLISNLIKSWRLDTFALGNCALNWGDFVDGNVTRVISFD